MFTRFLECVSRSLNYFLAHQDEHMTFCDMLNKSHCFANGQLSDDFKAACRQCLESEGFFQDDGVRSFNNFIYHLIGTVGKDVDMFRMTYYRALQFVGWLPCHIKKTSAYDLFVIEKLTQGMSSQQVVDAWVAVKGTQVESDYLQQASCIDDAKRKAFFDNFAF